MRSWASLKGNCLPAQLSLLADPPSPSLSSCVGNSAQSSTKRVARRGEPPVSVLSEKELAHLVAQDQAHQRRVQGGPARTGWKEARKLPRAVRG